MDNESGFDVACFLGTLYFHLALINLGGGGVFAFTVGVGTVPVAELFARVK